MKKIKFLIVALFAVLLCSGLAACSDDEPDQSAFLIGTWVKQSSLYNGAYSVGVRFDADGKGMYYSDYSNHNATPSEMTWLYDGETRMLALAFADGKMEYWTIDLISPDKIVYSYDERGYGTTRDCLMRVRVK